MTIGIIVLALASPIDATDLVRQRPIVKVPLSETVFRAGSTVVDERGGAVGLIVSVEQGLVTVKTPNTLVRMPINAFAMRGRLTLLGVTAGQIESISRKGPIAK